MTRLDSSNLAYDFKGNVLEKSRRVIRDEQSCGFSPIWRIPNANWDIRAFRVNWEPLEPQETARAGRQR